MLKRLRWRNDPLEHALCWIDKDTDTDTLHRCRGMGGRCAYFYKQGFHSFTPVQLSTSLSMSMGASHSQPSTDNVQERERGREGRREEDKGDRDGWMAWRVTTIVFWKATMDGMG